MSSEYTSSNGYEISDSIRDKSKSWQNPYMYKTSYLKQSEKNPQAIKNSTEQLLQTRSSSLTSISPRTDFINKPVENTDFINYDYGNLYRTSYTDMSTKEPKLINTHYVPKYQGFVPGLKSENPFGKNFTNLAKENIGSFNNRRFCTLNYDHEKLWQFNPVSKNYGSLSKNKTDSNLKRSLENHEFTNKIKDSGYDTNHNTFDRTGWVPHPSLHSDMIRTEYGIQYNRKKEIHYKGPLFCSGQIKIRELNYKHT